MSEVLKSLTNNMVEVVDGEFTVKFVHNNDDGTVRVEFGQANLDRPWGVELDDESFTQVCEWHTTKRSNRKPTLAGSSELNDYLKRTR